MRKSNLEKGNYYKLSSLIFFSCGLEIISDNIPYTLYSFEASSVKKAGKVKGKKGAKYSV